MHILPHPASVDLAIAIAIIKKSVGVIMAFRRACWDLDDDPHGNVQHIAEHGISKEEVEEVLEHPDGTERSRSSGLLIAFGNTSTGRLGAVVYEQIDDESVYPVTAYEVD